MSIYSSIRNLEDDLKRLQSFETRQIFKGCSLTHDANQNSESGAYTLMDWNTELYNTGSPYQEGMHSTQLTCTGTVAKTLGTKTLTGTGTSFTSQLWRGALIYAGTEFNTVTEVISDTSLTVYQNWGVTGSGLTCYRHRMGAVIVEDGVYSIHAGYLGSVDTCYVAIYRNRMLLGTAANNPEIISLSGGTTNTPQADRTMKLSMYDWIQVYGVLFGTSPIIYAYLSGTRVAYSPIFEIARIS